MSDFGVFTREIDRGIGVEEAGDLLDVQPTSPRKTTNAPISSVLIDADFGSSTAVHQEFPTAFEEALVTKKRSSVTMWSSELRAERSVAVEVATAIVNEQFIVEEVRPFESEGLAGVYAVLKKSGFHFDGANSERNARITFVERFGRSMVKGFLTSDVPFEEFEVRRVFCGKGNLQDRYLFDHTSISGDEAEPVGFLFGIYGVEERFIARVCRRIANRLAGDTALSKRVIDRAGSCIESSGESRAVHAFSVQAAYFVSLAVIEFRGIRVGAFLNTVFLQNFREPLLSDAITPGDVRGGASGLIFMANSKFFVLGKFGTATVALYMLSRFAFEAGSIAVSRGGNRGFPSASAPTVSIRNVGVLFPPNTVFPGGAGLAGNHRKLPSKKVGYSLTFARQVDRGSFIQITSKSLKVPRAAVLEPPHFVLLPIQYLFVSPQLDVRVQRASVGEVSATAFEECLSAEEIGDDLVLPATHGNRSVPVKIPSKVMPEDVAREKVRPSVGEGLGGFYTVSLESGVESRRPYLYHRRRVAIVHPVFYGIVAVCIFEESFKVLAIPPGEANAESAIQVYTSISGDEAEPVGFLFGIYGVEERLVNSVAAHSASSDYASLMGKPTDDFRANTHFDGDDACTITFFVKMASLVFLVLRELSLATGFYAVSLENVGDCAVRSIPSHPNLSAGQARAVVAANRKLLIVGEASFRRHQSSVRSEGGTSRAAASLRTVER